MSRGFPAQPDELTSIGIKLEAGDMERLAELGLPTSKFLQEKFPGKKVARVNTCFGKLLKRRRLELHAQDPEANKLFIIYNQGAWRIAYFEDDRELMEEVLATPAMQETTERLLGEPRPGEGGSCKRQTTLYDCVRGAPAGERGE